MTFVRSCLEPLKYKLINTGGKGKARQAGAKALQGRTFRSGSFIPLGSVCPVCPIHSCFPSASGSPFPFKDPSLVLSYSPPITRNVGGGLVTSWSQHRFLQQLVSGSSHSWGYTLRHVLSKRLCNSSQAVVADQKHQHHLELVRNAHFQAPDLPTPTPHGVGGGATPVSASPPGDSDVPSAISGKMCSGWGGMEAGEAAARQRWVPGS